MIRVVFEIFEEPWIRFAPTRSKLVYHAQQGWSGVLDIPMSRSRSRHRFTAGLAFNDIDELIEEYSGFRLAFESRMIGTERFGARFEFSRYEQSWEDATLSALALNPGLPELYRSRLTVEPTATFAFNPSVRINGGLSITELESLTQRARFTDGERVGRRHQRRPSLGVEGRTSIRGRRPAISCGPPWTDSAAISSTSDTSGRRAISSTSARARRIASLSLGYISGNAPLFERFSLGNSLTLRGWDKYDIAPLGGERMFHSSVEYRLWHIASVLRCRVGVGSKRGHEASLFDRVRCPQRQLFPDRGLSAE